jgi:hypothetical protein
VLYVCLCVCVSSDTHEPFSAAGAHARLNLLSSCRPRKDETGMPIQDSQFEFRGVVVKLSTFRKLVEERGGLDECSATKQWASVVRSPYTYLDKHFLGTPFPPLS